MGGGRGQNSRWGEGGGKIVGGGGRGQMVGGGREGANGRWGEGGGKW